MSLTAFELCCVAVLALALGALARARGWRALAGDYLPLAAAAWVSEHTCVEWYRHYAYAPGWHARLGHVPAIVALVWPVVVLSARDFVRALRPGPDPWRPLRVAAVVAFDASLVEVVAVRAGLWSWAEPGHLGVPLAGILGWGFFALAAEAAQAAPRLWRPAAVLLAVPVATHALILASWWGALRWVLRGDFGGASMLVVGAVGLGAFALVLRLRRQGRVVPPDVALPRAIAATLFLERLITSGPFSAPHWLHVAALTLPYVTATAPGTRGSGAAGAAPAPPRGT